MKTLSNLDLARVTGGSSEQAQSSLGSNDIMFMTMATLAMSQRQQSVVVVPGGGWHHRRHCW